MRTIQESLQSVKQFAENEGFIGFDPYDTLTSKINFDAFGKWGPIIAIQLQKRNPFNIRKWIGIEKGINPKAMGLFLNAYSQLYQLTNNPDDLAQAKFFFDWLISHPSAGYSGLCWGYNFDWASPLKFTKAYSPTVVVSGFVAKAIFEYYKVSKNEEAKSALQSISNFIINDIPMTIDDEGVCFSYSTEFKDCCYNASLLAGESLAIASYLKHDPKLEELAILSGKYVASKQHEDGHWNYSINSETGVERKQIDFHQGYVICSLNQIEALTKSGDADFSENIRKGLHYYRNVQFSRKGISKWRVPSKWPVDIHNQTQGIITFSELDQFDTTNLNFAETICIWTIKNMQSKSGSFNYKMYPFYSIKTPFIRWSNAWMFLAMVTYLKKASL